jgi:hypothetical protein
VAIDGDGGNGGGEQQHKNSNAISFLPPSAPNHITMHATNDNQQQTNKQSINFLHVKRRKRIKQHARASFVAQVRLNSPNQVAHETIIKKRCVSHDRIDRSKWGEARWQ